MLSAFSMSDVGLKRKENQDYVYASLEAIGPLPNLFLVADGMGGHKAGDFASKATVETMVEDIADTKKDSPVVVLREAIEKANQLIYTKATTDETMEGMGTTIVAASVIGNRVQVANVGDSRLYIIGEEMTQITIDHSLVEEMVRVGTIDKEEARNHPRKNIITRAVGVTESITPDFFTITLKEGEQILLCTDGLTNMLEDEEIFQMIKAPGSVEEKVTALVAEANERGGKDNISVIIVDPAIEG